MVALTAITSGFAQYYNGEPVGTVYTYEMSNPIMGTTTIEQTLLTLSEDSISFGVASSGSLMGQTINATHKYTFKDGKSYTDPQNIIKASLATMFETLYGGNEDKNLSSNDFDFIPLVTKVGDKFPQETIESAVDDGAGGKVKSKLETTKVEVVREEELITPAGTFQTLVVEMNSKITLDAFGQSQVMETVTLYWIVPSKGMVKMEQSTMGQTFSTTLVSIK